MCIYNGKLSQHHSPFIDSYFLPEFKLTPETDVMTNCDNFRFRHVIQLAKAFGVDA